MLADVLTAFFMLDGIIGTALSWILVSMIGGFLVLKVAMRFR